jgi:hypothetical protein
MEDFDTPPGTFDELVAFILLTSLDFECELDIVDLIQRGHTCSTYSTSERVRSQVSYTSSITTGHRSAQGLCI